MMNAIYFHIFLALGSSRAHGYAIMQEISKRTDGRVEILPGTLYSTIKKMLAEGLLEECPPPAGEASTDERRRYYRVTRAGHARASQETERLAMLVRLARKKGFAPAR